MNTLMKLANQDETRQKVLLWQKSGKKIVFSNGCFDILHAGHVEYLTAAKKLGDILLIGLNSDNSVRRLKGPKRPLCNQTDRAAVLAALEVVDALTIFDEDTPEELIACLLPDILVKGADWEITAIAGSDTVLANGGKVLTLPLLEGRSTSSIIEKIVQRYS